MKFVVRTESLDILPYKIENKQCTYLENNESVVVNGVKADVVYEQTIQAVLGWNFCWIRYSKKFQKGFARLWMVEKHVMS